MTEIIETVIAAGILVIAIKPYIGSPFKKRPVTRRLEKISDEALEIVLRLFTKRKVDNSRKCRRLDVPFVDGITSMLVDKALTAKQIRSLFSYTFTHAADIELQKCFGWEEALHEAVAAAEEEALLPPKPVIPQAKLPPISDENFKAFMAEFFAGNVNEIEEMVLRWPYSFTLAQQSIILARMSDTRNPKEVTDRSVARRQVRALMQIHQT